MIQGILDQDHDPGMFNFLLVLDGGIVIYLLATLQRKLITMIFARSVRIGIDTRNIWWNCGVVPDHHLYLALFINILALSHTILSASGGKSWASSTSCLSIFFSWFIYIYIYACMRKNILSAYLDFVILLYFGCRLWYHKCNHFISRMYF